MTSAQRRTMRLAWLRTSVPSPPDRTASRLGTLGLVLTIVDVHRKIAMHKRNRLSSDVKLALMRFAKIACLWSILS